MKKILPAAVLLALLWSLNAPVSRAVAQGATAFTYQGQLHDTGTNANGAYTMIFVLYDSASGGNSIGTNTSSVTPANGLFSINLDFGAGAFNGSARWLDITITNGGVTQELSPRVQVLPAPYALYAADANVSASATGLTSGTWSASVGNVQGNSGTVSNVFLLYDNGSLVLALGTNGGVAPGISAIPHNIQVFNSSGTFVIPAYVTTVMVEVWGGGGGGGGGGNGFGGSTYGSNGGGGGGGGYGKDVITVTPGNNMAVTVGSGGAGGSAGGGVGSSVEQPALARSAPREGMAGLAAEMAVAVAMAAPAMAETAVPARRA